MQIIEQALIPKNPSKKSEDGIVVTADYVAVIDGSTSKTDRRFSLFSTNGRYAMLLISRYIRRAPANLSCHQFCTGVTRYVSKHYSRRSLPRLAEHPEERLTASAVVYSRLNRQVWLIGDCHCLIGGDYYDNPKPYEDELANMRADEVRRQLAAGVTTGQLLANDTARPTIIPHMIETMKEQNRTYAVIDGFPIPQQHVRTVTLDFQPWELVFATDGYPFLRPTLQESETLLQQQHRDDPLNIGRFKATKAFMTANNSFDDRAYIRFRV